MGKDLQKVSQYELTNDIIKNHFAFDIKDGALKVLLILSTHYPEIYVQRKSLIKRYKIAEKTVDRALKELEEKNYISRQNDGKITVNLAVIYGQIDGEKVVNLAVPCINQHEKTEKANQHANSQIDGLLLSVLSSFGFSPLEAEKLVKDYAVQSVQKYVDYVKSHKAENPKKYLLWCLKEKPNTQPSVVKEVTRTDAERYNSLMESKNANWLNSKQHAETFLANTSQFDLRNENVLKDCIAIMLYWKFDINDYSTLSLIDDAAANNENFKQKCAKLTAEVYENLQTAKMTAKTQIAC